MHTIMHAWYTTKRAISYNIWSISLFIDQEKHTQNVQGIKLTIPGITMDFMCMGMVESTMLPQPTRSDTCCANCGYVWVSPFTLH